MKSVLKREHFFINLLLTIIGMLVKLLRRHRILPGLGLWLPLAANRILEQKKKFLKKELLICTINVIRFVNEVWSHTTVSGSDWLWIFLYSSMRLCKILKQHVRLLKKVLKRHNLWWMNASRGRLLRTSKRPRVS